MKRYFTSITDTNGNFVGTVFDQNTNQELYKSKAYPTQLEAMQDVNTFLITQKTPKKFPLPTSSTPRRCCGR